MADQQRLVYGQCRPSSSPSARLLSGHDPSPAPRRAPLPERARTDEYFARDAEVRARLHQVFRGP